MKTFSLFMVPSLFCLALTLPGCGGDGNSTPPDFDLSANRLGRLSLEEREELAPNELFEAIYEEDLAKVKSIVQQSPHLLESKNAKYGELPFVAAMRLRLKAIADYLVLNSPLKLYSVPNAQGESPMFLASKYGFPEIINQMGLKFYESHTIQLVYSVDGLDYPDSKGRKALHVAADRRVVEALYQEHQRGYLKIPYFGLFIHQDQESQNFLHAAAQDGRSDVILWAAENFCGAEWKDSDNTAVSVVGNLTLWPLRAFQSYFPWSTPLDHPMNHQDLHYKTPLHYAAENHQLGSMTALASCQWTDYDLSDENGELAFHLFLKSLDPQERLLSRQERQILRMFIHRQTFMRKVFVNTEHYINAVDKLGRTPLHYAAQLADPWAYEELISFGGDRYLRDNEGLRPFDLFQQRQKQVKARR
jgi:hypothetical protein